MLRSFPEVISQKKVSQGEISQRGRFPEGRIPRRNFPRRSVSQMDSFPEDSFFRRAYHSQELSFAHNNFRLTLLFSASPPSSFVFLFPFSFFFLPFRKPKQNTDPLVTFIISWSWYTIQKKSKRPDDPSPCCAIVCRTGKMWGTNRVREKLGYEDDLKIIMQYNISLH